MALAQTSPTQDPFAAVKAALVSDVPNVQPSNKEAGAEQLLSPVPETAPPVPTSFRGLGSPSSLWEYRDAEGKTLRFVARFETENGKEIRPLTLWCQASGAIVWRMKSEPHSARPIYGLDRLAARPSAPVLITEGEKDCDAAGVRFPEYVAVTWSGGANAVSKTDFTPLKGRRVVIWGDADEAGAKAAEAVRQAAMEAGAESASVVDLPNQFPKGWGLADDWPESFGLPEAQQALKRALEASERQLALPYGYRLDETGLFHDSGKGGSDGPNWVKISGPFEIVGEARDPNGGGWSVVIRFRDPDGRWKTEIISRAQLTSEAGAVRARLAGEGLMMPSSRGKGEKLSQFFAELETANRLKLVNATGWIADDSFVLPKRVISANSSEEVLFTGDASGLHYREKGSLEGWQKQVAAKAVGNPHLAFAIALAFAGCLLRPLGLEGGGFHFRGPSSCGKTSLIYAAGSVWGGGGALGAAHSWRTTSNALENLAYAHNDLLLPLDELGLVAPEEAGQAAYSLASGQAKGRSRQDGSMRKRAEWRTLILSTGEISLADHIRSSRRGDRAMAGQELRLLDIAADAGANMGIWSTLIEAGSPAAMSDALKAACQQHYGHAGPAFIERFVAEGAVARHQAATLAELFVEEVKRPGDHGQVHRAALRFAVVAAAGELASAMGIVPWPERLATDAAHLLFNRWAASFGRDGPQEKRTVLYRIRGYLEQEASRFAVLSESYSRHPEASDREAGFNAAEEARSLKSLGYRCQHGGETFYLFHNAGWNEVFEGLDKRFAAKALLEEGFLVRGDGNHLKKMKRIQGQNQRLYWVRASILAADFGDEIAL